MPVGGPLGPLPVARGQRPPAHAGHHPAAGQCRLVQHAYRHNGQDHRGQLHRVHRRRQTPRPHRDGLAFALDRGPPAHQRLRKQPAGAGPLPGRQLTAWSTAPAATASASAGSMARAPTLNGRKEPRRRAHHLERRCQHRWRSGVQRQPRRPAEGPGWLLTDPPGVGEQDPHIRTGRWYGTVPAANNVSPSIYGASTNARPVHMGVQLKPVSAGTWHAKVYVDGALVDDTNVSLPNVVYMGFTAGTGEFPQRHAISDVTVKYGTVSAPTVTAPASVDLRRRPDRPDGRRRTSPSPTTAPFRSRSPRARRRPSP